MTSGFNWQGVPNATEYYLYVGGTVGDKDLANSGEGPQTSFVPLDLPVSQLLYVRPRPALSSVDWR